jgi:hypothetical protein
MIQEPANLPICCSLLLLRLLHLLHPPLQQMAAAGRHIDLLTSFPQNKKPQEEQEQEEKNTKISPYSHTAFTERFSTKTRNKFSKETEEGRRAGAGAGARHRRCCETKAREERETRVNDDDPKAPNPTTRENDDDRIYPKGTYKQGCIPVFPRFRQSNKYQLLEL